MKYIIKTKSGRSYRAKSVEAGLGFVVMKFWYGELRLPAGEILSIHKRYIEQAAEKIVRPPGYRELGLISFFVSPQKIENVYEPIIADWNVEYYEALSKSKPVIRVFFIRVRYMYALISALGLDAIVKKAVSFLANK